MNDFNMLRPTRSDELPDIAQSDTSSHATALDWVGMGSINLPLQVPISQANQLQVNPMPTEADLSASSVNIQTVNTSVACFVNLKDPNTKGIHMSRLYLLLTEFAENELLLPSLLTAFANRMLASHADISDKTKITFQFPLLLKRPALKSQYAGWKSYPCEVDIQLIGTQVQILATVSIAYSSTCPCSAALARQLLQQEFAKDFADQPAIARETVEAWIRSPKGSFATPHSQRSEAIVQVQLDNNAAAFQFVDIIDAVENALGTPVQTAVKREDEQEFAKLNGQNLMFCEDSARRIHHTLTNMGFPDFKAKVSHFESLHAHDAVSMTSKGVVGGLTWQGI